MPGLFLSERCTWAGEVEGIGQEDTEDLPGRGSSPHRPRNAGVGAPPGSQEALVVGT